MTLVADIPGRPVSNESTQPAAADPRIAVAETWLCMLGGLMEVAKRFSRFLVHEIMPFGPGPKAPFLALRFSGDPAAVLKRVARTARFAVVLYLKIQKQIAAWKAGEPFDLEAFLAEAPRISARAKAGRDAADGDEEDDMEDAWEDLEEWENLCESETLEVRERFDFLGGPGRQSREDKYQALLRGPLKDAIAAICKELGLKPDWSLWTDKGFPPPAEGGIEDWVAFFAPKAAAVAPPCPKDEAGARAWRRKWWPRDRPERAAPPFRTVMRLTDRGGSP